MIMSAKILIRDFILEAASKLNQTIDLKDNDDIFKQNLVNSMFAMKLIRFIETTFQVKCVPADLSLSNFNTINNMIEFIEKKRRKLSCM